MAQSDDAAARLRAFRARVDYAPHTVMRHRSRHWRYIPGDPFADEPEILTHLGRTPEQCRCVEAFWETEEDAVLLRVQPACDDPERDAGLYARWVHGDRPSLVLLGLPDREPVTRTLFEEMMCAFWDCGLLQDVAAQARLSSATARVGDCG